jgi:hypothetical protein
MTGHGSKIPGILKYNSRRQGNGGGEWRLGSHLAYTIVGWLHRTLYYKYSRSVKCVYETPFLWLYRSSACGAGMGEEAFDLNLRESCQGPLSTMQAFHVWQGGDMGAVGRSGDRKNLNSSSQKYQRTWGHGRNTVRVTVPPPIINSLDVTYYHRTGLLCVSVLRGIVASDSC